MIAAAFQKDHANMNKYGCKEGGNECKASFWQRGCFLRLNHVIYVRMLY